MKKFVVFVLLMIFIIPSNALATGGGLRKNSIKTCPDGVTYGMHSDGKGGTHWHVAATNGENYYASGEALVSDPCPGYTKNSGTAKATTGSNTSTSTGSQNPPSTTTQSTTVPPVVTNTVSDNSETPVDQTVDPTPETDVVELSDTETVVTNNTVSDNASSDIISDETTTDDDTLDTLVGGGMLAAMAGGAYAVVKSKIKKKQ